MRPAIHMGNWHTPPVCCAEKIKIKSKWGPHGAVQQRKEKKSKKRKKKKTKKKKKEERREESGEAESERGRRPRTEAKPNSQEERK